MYNVWHDILWKNRLMCNMSDRPLCEPSSVSILSGNSAQQIFTEQLLSLRRWAGRWGCTDSISEGYGFVSSNGLLTGYVLNTVLRALCTLIS